MAEQVEDVMTFLHILLVMTTFTGYYVGGEDVSDMAIHLNNGRDGVVLDLIVIRVKNSS